MKYGEVYEDSKRFRLALISAIVFHLALAALFVFSSAWEPANPPPLNPGIEINLGFQDLGKSTFQPDNVEESDLVNESQNIDPVDEDTIDTVEAVEKTEQPDESTQSITPTPSQKSNTETQQNIDNNVKSKALLTQEDESVPLKVTAKEAKPKKENKTAPVKKEQTKSKPKVDKSLFFKKQKNKKTKKTNNNGESPSGDNGKDGKKTASSTSGASLNLSGWQWDSPPSIYDESAEAGKIVFEITIDELGNILSVVTIERTVTPSVEQKYIKAVQSLTFHSVGATGTDKKHSIGYITFILKSK